MYWGNSTTTYAHKDFICNYFQVLTMKGSEMTSKQPAKDQEELVLVNNSRVSRSLKTELFCFSDCEKPREMRSRSLF